MMVFCVTVGDEAEADVFDEVLISINGKDAAVVGATTLPELGLMEREHLQAWVLSHPELLGAGATVVTSEYDKWQAASGALVADRLDVLALGTDGRLIVVELKRDFAPQTVHMQAVNYAAMVSRLTPRDVADLWSTWHGQDEALDVDSALAELQTKWLLTPDSIKSPRIVLMAADFPASVTASVVWLNEQGVSVDLIRFRAYQVNNGQILVNFSRLYPVPSIEDFTIGRRLPERVNRGRSPRCPLGTRFVKATGGAGQRRHDRHVGPVRRRRSERRHCPGHRHPGRHHRRSSPRPACRPHHAPEEPEVQVRADSMAVNRAVAEWRSCPLPDVGRTHPAVAEGQRG